MKAGKRAGFNCVEYKMQQSHPDFRDHPVVRRYVDECKQPDYIMKFKNVDV